jgi:hypothetical protein
MISRPAATTIDSLSDEGREPGVLSGPMKGRIVAIYIVERRLPELSLEHLVVAHRALAESSRRVSMGGDSVRYLRSTFSPAVGRCVCMFEATSKDLVRRVNEVAQVPFDRIDEAVHFENPGANLDSSGDTL